MLAGVDPADDGGRPRARVGDGEAVGQALRGRGDRGACADVGGGAGQGLAHGQRGGGGAADDELVEVQAELADVVTAPVRRRRQEGRNYLVELDGCLIG